MEHEFRLKPAIEILRSGPNGFLLHDPRSGRCINLDTDERLLLYLLMNSRSSEDVCNTFQARSGQEISRVQVEAFVEQLRTHDFLLSGGQQQESESTGRSETPPALCAPLSLSHRGAKLNFFFDVLVLLFGWALHPLWMAPLLLVVVGSLHVYARYGGQLVAEFHRFVDPQPILLYVVFYILPKLFLLSLLQASLAGIVCRRFGGRIHRAGVHFHGGVVPLFRTRLDVSVMTQLNRSGRLTLLSIGLWVPIVLASVSALAWAATSPSSGLRILYVLLIPPCLIRLAINCNIFFRFSSLHLLLCEAVGERRLLRVAERETLAWLLRRPLSNMTLMKRAWVRLYGVGYFAYRIGALLGLAIGGAYLVMTYADSQELPPWSIEYAIVSIAFFCSRNAEPPRVTHEQRLSWRLQPVV